MAEARAEAPSTRSSPHTPQFHPAYAPEEVEVTTKAVTTKRVYRRRAAKLLPMLQFGEFPPAEAFSQDAGYPFDPSKQRLLREEEAPIFARDHSLVLK